MHYIQTYILDKLVFTEYLRNKDMRPPNIESNLYQYHLKQLQKYNYIKKVENFYTLSSKGLSYAGLHSTELRRVRPQPSALVVVFVENANSELLIRTKHRQPFIGMKSLLMSKLHLGESVKDAAKREFQARLSQLSTNSFEQFASAHVAIFKRDCLLSDYFAILLKVKVNSGFRLPDNAHFINPYDSIYNLAPGINEMIGLYLDHASFGEFTIYT